MVGNSNMLLCEGKVVITGLVSMYFMGVDKLFIYACAVILYVCLSIVFGYMLSGNIEYKLHGFLGRPMNLEAVNLVSYGSLGRPKSYVLFSIIGVVNNIQPNIYFTGIFFITYNNVCLTILDVHIFIYTLYFLYLLG